MTIPLISMDSKHSKFNNWNKPYNGLFYTKKQETLSRRIGGKSATSSSGTKD